MPVKQISLFQSACGKLRVSRMGMLTMLVVDGQGLALALTSDFSVVEKWAKSKGAGPNATIDMAKIMEKLDVLVCRPGTTFGSTRGSTKPLEAVVKAMKAAGMDTREYALPPELKDADRPVDQVLAARAAKKESEEMGTHAKTEPKAEPTHGPKAPEDDKTREILIFGRPNPKDKVT
jgi:hypothetical protein